MAGKGQLDATMDAGLLAKVTMHVSRYTEQMNEISQSIRSACRQMQEEETLKGGEGDVLRELFAQIATGCTQIEKSNRYISDKLNEKLRTVIAMSKNTTSGEAEDAMRSATKKAGVLKKE